MDAIKEAAQAILIQDIKISQCYWMDEDVIEKDKRDEQKMREFRSKVGEYRNP